MIYRLFIVMPVLMLAAGCAYGPADSGTPPEQIGDTEHIDATGLDAYETAVVGLLNRMTDAVVLLAGVEDASGSEQLAGMIDEARPSFVALRQEMKDHEATRQTTQAELILNYGSRYLWATLQYRQEMDRLKELGPAVHDPIRGAIDRLKKDLKDAGLPNKPE